MTGMTTLKIRPEFYNGTTAGAEPRRYWRYNLTLLGRFMRADKQEYPCRLNDISLGSASLSSDIRPGDNERIIVQFEEIGLLEGLVVCVFADGFAIQFSTTHRRRHKLAAQLTWALNRHELNASDQRRPGHDRITLIPKPVAIRMDDGQTYERNVLDVSISGASIQTEMRPAIGSTIVVGRLPAKVVRHHDRGVSVEFQHIQKLERIREDFG